MSGICCCTNINQHHLPWVSTITALSREEYTFLNRIVHLSPLLVGLSKKGNIRNTNKNLFTIIVCLKFYSKWRVEILQDIFVCLSWKNKGISENTIQQVYVQLKWEGNSLKWILFGEIKSPSRIFKLTYTDCKCIELILFVSFSVHFMTTWRHGQWSDEVNK